MKQLIDKSALIAEIERRIKRLKDCHADMVAGYAGEISGLERLLSFIDTLETKEVDLEKEIYNYLDDHNLNIQDGGRIVFNTNGDTPNFWCDFRDIAKHFFELGFKAQRGWSSKNTVVIEGICSDKDFIDTKHGILAFGAEEGSYRPFNDGDRVNIIITKGE